MADLAWIKQNGKTAQGKAEYLEYLETGNKLPPTKAIKANCYHCMNSFLDGKVDCEISDCPLYPYQPYRKGKARAKRIMTEKQQEAVQKLASIRSGARRTATGSK